ncbi:MAG TPA: hypothetical protein DCY53_01445 [Desulfobacteraceae bacterium]|nr:hypothetical protein [Desulfobacteraceae bacterium]
MIRKLTIISMVFTLMVWITSFSVYASGPNFFNPAIYADGEAWATKGVADLPPPNEHNHQSFDKLFSFTNGANGQLPVAEAAPGNPNYNGGRWDLKLVTWTIINPPIVMSYDGIEWYLNQGDLIITSGNSYFECPLLPLR